MLACPALKRKVNQEGRRREKWYSENGSSPVRSAGRK